jgi:hypothetical protein
VVDAAELRTVPALERLVSFERFAAFVVVDCCFLAGDIHTAGGLHKSQKTVAIAVFFLEMAQFLFFFVVGESAMFPSHTVYFLLRGELVDQCFITSNNVSTDDSS